MTKYEELMKNLAKGWNTWNTRSVLSHVLLPGGFAVNLGIKEYASGKYLKEALIGRFGKDEEVIHPGPHAYDGSYTELNLKWHGLELIVKSALEGDDLVILVTPVKMMKYPPMLVVESGILWNQPGVISLDGDMITASLPDGKIYVYAAGEAAAADPNIAVQTPYLSLSLDGEAGVSTGRRRTLVEIRAIIEAARLRHSRIKMKYGQLSEAYNAMQSCMAWDTIYEPKKKRVVTPVSRIWNVRNGGYALFCWDTYFAAFMAALDNKELAYANAVEITREKTSDNFVPNCAWGTGFKSSDRSQPPVGSMVVRELYRRFGDKWLLEELFEDLFKWNRWFLENRGLDNGTLAWGSNPYTPKFGGYWETTGVNETFGGALESGLDNSPMYDGIPFDEQRHILKLADVGLTGLFIMDCRTLADIAEVLGRKAEALQLLSDADKSEKGLQTLWDESTGIFLNRRTDTGEFSPKLSPTNFYALLGDEVSEMQAKRMMEEHFYNPSEFWGEWIMPSISRNDPAYPEQDYWRGRIWAPMNLLVYLGLRRQNLSKARRDMADKSRQLLLKEWLERGHVHENYSGDTGEGCNKPNSDKFYHWGALLSLIALMEDGFMSGPEEIL